MNNEEKLYCVYKHTNKINGKIYVGKTCANPPEKRWRNDGSGYMKSPLFWNAIQKYGWDNFDHEILIDNLTEKQANELEKQFISDLKSNDREFGYNLTDGGDGVRLLGESHPRYGIHLDESVKKKISDTHKKRGSWQGENNPNYNKHNFTGEGNPFYGMHHTEETKRRLRELATGRPSPMKGKQFSDEARKNMKESGRKRCKPVIHLDLSDNIIATYQSLQEASDLTGFNKSSISSCCRGKTKTSYGFIWRYKENE